MMRWQQLEVMGPKEYQCHGNSTSMASKWFKCQYSGILAYPHLEVNWMTSSTRFPRSKSQCRGRRVLPTYGCRPSGLMWSLPAVSVHHVQVDHLGIGSSFKIFSFSWDFQDPLPTSHSTPLQGLKRYEQMLWNSYQGITGYEWIRLYTPKTSPGKKPMARWMRRFALRAQALQSKNWETRLLFSPGKLRVRVRECQNLSTQVHPLQQCPCAGEDTHLHQVQYIYKY